MILLLSRAVKPPIPPELADLGDVKVFRVPQPPRGRRAGGALGPGWAVPRIAELRPLLAGADIELIACSDDRALPFAWRVADTFPDVPVLSDPVVAARILRLMRDRGLPITSSHVRTLLDPLRTPPVPVPAYFRDPAARPPMVVSLVGGTVDDDTRVLNTARSVSGFGCDSVVIGRSPNSSEPGDYFLAGGALVLRPRVTLEQLSAQLAAPPGGPVARLLGFRSRAAEQAAVRRLERLEQQSGRLRGRERVTRLRLRASQRNRDSFVTPGARSSAHRWAAFRQGHGIAAASPEVAFPAIADYRGVMTPLVVSLFPDIIHVHDPVLLDTAFAAKAALAELGQETLIVYDAREFTPGLERDHMLQVPALTHSEDELVPRTDAVVAASEELAALLAERHRLRRRPAVVTDARDDRLDASPLRTVYSDLLGDRTAAQTPAPTGGVMIGGMNSAGQATAWARALREAGVPARSLELRSPDNPFHHAAGTMVPRDSVYTLQRRVQLMLREIATADTVILESGRAIAAPEPDAVPFRRLGFREAHALARSGRNVGLMFHGSDLRRPDVHARTHRWSPFRVAEPDPIAEQLLRRTRSVHEQLAHWDGPVLVSTPDLIGLAAGAVWVPVVVDLDVFTPAVPRPPASLPLVVHLPSRSSLKGSALIDPVLQGLAARGLIRYRKLVEVRHTAVPRILAEADIFVDQLGMGIFGVAALEALAMGIPVVTDPGPEALHAYGEPVPIVTADPETLGAAVAALAGDAQRRAELSEAARPFVVRHHDGRRSAAALIDAMGLG